MEEGARRRGRDSDANSHYSSRRQPERMAAAAAAAGKGRALPLLAVAAALAAALLYRAPFSKVLLPSPSMDQWMDGWMGSRLSSTAPPRPPDSRICGGGG